MNLTGRLLLGYFLIVALAAWFVLNVFRDEVKPGVKYALEETLIDTSQLLAALAATDLKAGTLNDGRFARAVARYRLLDGQTPTGVFKDHHMNLRVYVTDARGIVVYDSAGKALGQDYSHWNDVYLTLHGKYGARTTRDEESDPSSSVMYVAAPVMVHGKLIGVLTVAKPTSGVQPFIDRSRSRIAEAGLWLMGVALIFGLLITWRLTGAIGKLRRYAREVSLGHTASLPRINSGELNELGKALADMREKLDGREYVENYVHHLAHEMKSPLTALIGSAELLDGDMPAQERANFIVNIREQSRRLKDMTDKLLALARLEHRSSLEEAAPVDLVELAQAAIADHSLRLQQHNLTCHTRLPYDARVIGEAFLLRQAIANLLDNAIDFSPQGGTIELALETADGSHILTVHDQGPGIPDYAMPRIFERFYSLARPGNRRKSTGLGLPFVREVAVLHSGSITLANAPEGGTLARLTLPAA